MISGSSSTGVENESSNLFSSNYYWLSQVAITWKANNQVHSKLNPENGFQVQGLLWKHSCHNWQLLSCHLSQSQEKMICIKYAGPAIVINTNESTCPITPGWIEAVHVAIRKCRGSGHSLDGSEVSGSDISQSSEICHGFFVKMTWIGCHVDGGWVRLLSGNKASQVFWWKWDRWDGFFEPVLGHSMICKWGELKLFSGSEVKQGAVWKWRGSAYWVEVRYITLWGEFDMR